MRTHRHVLIAICLSMSFGCDKSPQPTPQEQAKKTTPDGASPQANDGIDAAVDADAPASEDDVLAALDPRVRRASEIAENIERDPENSDQVLAQANLDREGLDELMYEIAMDAELASQYRIARGLRVQ